jgi:hypothetical protein
MSWHLADVYTMPDDLPRGRRHMLFNPTQPERNYRLPLRQVPKAMVHALHSVLARTND